MDSVKVVNQMDFWSIMIQGVTNPMYLQPLIVKGVKRLWIYGLSCMQQQTTLLIKRIK